jgi:hypothetical protein
MKITFPNMTKEEAVELVENRYGAMYWQLLHNKKMAYPYDVDKPVIIEFGNDADQKEG